MDFGQILQASLSSDQRSRENATRALEQAARDNFPVYLSSLCRELCDENKNTEIRQIAGVTLKNSLVSKDSNIRNEYGQRWMNIDGSLRKQLKVQILSILQSNNLKASTAAAQAIAAIAFVELPLDAWPELFPSLLQNAQSPLENLRRSTLETIGFICEEIEPEILENLSNKILTAIICGLRSEEPSVAVRSVAANALLNSLEFAKNNFATSNERDVIMETICNATQSQELNIVLPAFECLTRSIQLYYHYMESYMDRAISQLTMNSMRSSNETVVLQAIEFWSTVCETERNLQEAESCDFHYLGFSEKVLPHLLPNLLALLKHNDEYDTDEWNIPMASGSCLSLLAECVKDKIFIDNVIFDFVSKNIASSEWNSREAAVMALGAVMDGPNGKNVIQLIKNGMPYLIQLLSRDPSVSVRDTTAWAIGHVIDYFNNIIEDEPFLPEIVNVLMKGLEDAPRVAVNCCWSLMSYFVHYGDCYNQADYIEKISPYFSQVSSALYLTAQRKDVEECNLRTAAYQSLSNVILYAPMDCVDMVKTLQLALIKLMEESQSIASQIVSADDSMRYSDLQSQLCSVLQNCLKKLGKPSLEVSNKIMNIVLSLLQNASQGKGSATELEDVFLMVGTLASEIGEEFDNFSGVFMRYLYFAIKSHAAYNFCMVAIGVASDLARALGQNIVKYSNDLMTLLLECLHDTQLAREVKPHAITAIGDIAFAIGGSYFHVFMQPTLALLCQASTVQVTDPEDYDEIDFVCEFRESLLAAFTSIVQISRDDQQALSELIPFVDKMLTFVHTVSQDENRTDVMVRSAIGLIGDLVSTFPMEMKPLVQQEWLNRFISHPWGDTTEQLTESTLSVIKWTSNVIRQIA